MFYSHFSCERQMNLTLAISHDFAKGRALQRILRKKLSTSFFKIMMNCLGMH